MQLTTADDQAALAALAERFGVSRTPVREALQRLSASGLVELTPRRGTRVLNPSIGRIVEMFEVMAELEAMCGRLAARRMTPDEHARLVAAHEACARATESGDPSAYFEANGQFHEAIYSGSGNEFLAEQARALQSHLKPYRRLQLHVRNRVGNSFQEHEAIVAAILAGDDTRTEEALRAHILIQGERFNDFVASLRPRDGAS